jgi:fagellar hook-basal body proteins
MAAFSIPLSGLAAASSSLSVIGNNLANLNTDGYKKKSLDFSSVYNQMLGTSGNGDPIQLGNGVKIAGTSADFSDGNVNSTGVDSNMALQGKGFFVVQGTDGYSYTRAGNFTVNSSGQLCTAQGELVMGYPATNGVVSTSSPLGPIVVNETNVVPASASKSFEMTTNLNAAATTGTTFSSPITVYDSLGQSHTLSVTFTNTAQGQWDYSVTLPAADTGGTGNATQVASGSLSFDSSGVLTSPTGSVSGINITGLADGAADMSLTWNLFGTGGNPTITQQAAASATSATAQDGYTSGTLTGYTVDASGIIQGEFSNNKTFAIGQVAVASFANEQGLKQVGNNDYKATFSSGAAIVGQAGIGGNGTISGGGVEQSNVDMAAEFANMIVAEQTYQANAKVISTLNQVSQATLQAVS